MIDLISKRIELLVCGIFLLLWLTPAVAQDALSPKTHSGTATIRGILTTEVTGACITSEAYANKCFGGMCSCLTFDNAKVNGNLVGKGTGTVSITLDTGDAPPVGSNPDPLQTCTPVHAAAIVATATSKVSNVSATIDFQGSLCFPTKNNGTKEHLGGGFAISSATDGSYGWGSLSGNLNDTTNLLNLTFKGSFTP